MKKIPIMIVTLVIGFIMVTAAVMPLAADYSEAKTFTNEGYYRMGVVSTTDTITIEYDPSDTQSITLNGDKITMPNRTVSVVCSDQMMIRYAYNNPTSSGLHMYATGGIGVYADSDNSIGMTVTIANGTVTATTTSSTTGTYTPSTDIFCINPDGVYTMKKYDTDAYLNGDSVIFACGRTSIAPGASASVSTKGDIDNGMSAVTVFHPTTPETTAGDVTINYLPISNYIDLYEFSNLEFILSQSDVSINANYSAVIVPYEITAEPDNPDTFKNMVRIVPLIALVALVAAAAGMIYFKGKE